MCAQGLVVGRPFDGCPRSGRSIAVRSCGVGARVRRLDLDSASFVLPCVHPAYAFAPWTLVRAVSVMWPGDRFDSLSGDFGREEGSFATVSSNHWRKRSQSGGYRPQCDRITVCVAWSRAPPLTSPRLYRSFLQRDWRIRTRHVPTCESGPKTQVGTSNHPPRGH